MKAFCCLSLAALAAACGLKSNVIECEGGRVCPESTVCDEVHRLCVLPEQVSQCDGQPDRTRCDVRGTLGTCQTGVCLEAGCGNGRPDLQMADANCTASACVDPYEQCDDGNNIDGDGCSGNCLSEETCGNQIVDVIVGERCDDGNLLDHDGCSSTCEEEGARWVQVGSPGPISLARAVYDARRDRVVMFGGRINTSTATPPATGITNAVSEWDGMWHRSVPVTVAPAPRDKPPNSEKNVTASFGLAYAHDLGMTILAGGEVSFEASRETWGWDGATWKRLANLPYPVTEPAMAYDARRKRVVLFGGTTRESVPPRYDKTLEFDGTQWIEASPIARPTGRSKAGMSYDPKRGVIVMYGGLEFGGNAGTELWEYDGTTWTLKAGPNASPSMTAPMMAYDSTSNRTVIYGDEQDTLNATLLWDGNSLVTYSGAQPVAPAPSATTSARSGAVLVPDGTGRLLLFGGQDRGSFSTQPQLLLTRLMWFWDGAAWVEANGEPPAVAFAAGTTIPESQAFVRFGGAPTANGGPPATGETWTLTRRGWTLTTSTDPPGLALHAITYDSVRRELVMFGGSTASAATDVTYTKQRGSTIWVPHAPSGNWPSARGFHAMAFDAARGETVMFGGLAGSNRQGDTWIWNGTSWALRTPVHSPSPRSGAAMAFDPIRGVVVLFGGYEGTGGDTRNDTWCWDGTDWHEVTSFTDVPDARNGAFLTWNPARQSLLLTQDFDLGGQVMDAWELELTSATSGTWTTVPVGLRPSFRALAVSFTTRDGSGGSLIGGLGGGATGTTDEHWELRWDHPEAAFDSCLTPFDVDGDGAIGCDDADCWRTCTPECPPGTSCLMTTLRCGDSVCGDIENCRICPQDCGTCTDTRCGDFSCDPGETCPGDCP